MIKLNSDAPTLDDFLEEGRALEAVKQISESIHEDDMRSARPALSECRELAMGIIAVTSSSMGVLLEIEPCDDKLAYCLACIVAFAQGAAISRSLIAKAQYMKAAAVLKQDIELLAQFREIVEDRAKRKRTPTVSGLADWARMFYGQVNKIAHPAKVEEMHSVLSFPDGNLSILPLRRPDTEAALFQAHVWNCIESSSVSIELLSLLIETRLARPETNAVLTASFGVFEQLSEKAKRLSE